MIDISWTTPVFQRPLKKGIDVVLHSASKYISGRSSTVAGVVISTEPIITQLRGLTCRVSAPSSPLQGLAAARGLHTLPTRMREHL